MIELNKYIKECGEGGGLATPSNTLGMGNPMVDGNTLSEPLPTAKVKKERTSTPKRKKLKESLLKNISQDDDSIRAKKIEEIEEYLRTYISGDLSGFTINKDFTIDFDMHKSNRRLSGYLNAYFDDNNWSNGGPGGYGWTETKLPSYIKFGTFKCNQVSFEGWYKLKSLKNFPKQVTGKVCFVNCFNVNWNELKNIKADSYSLVNCFDEYDTEDLDEFARKFEKEHHLKPNSVTIYED